MANSDEFLGVDVVEGFRESEQYENAAEAVMSQLGERLKNADGTGESVQLLGAATSALADLVRESDEPEAVVQRAKDESGDVARRSGKKKDRITDLIDDATREILDERREERLDRGEGLSVPEGVGLDEYLEGELEEIVRQQSTDAVDDPVLRWRFADGVRIETSESVHHDYYALFKKLASATDKRLVPELASEQVEDELRDDEDVDDDAYARLSLGPKTRPWHTDNALWSRAISGLVQERIRTETVVGPRTDAWESIQARVRSGRAVRDLTDAVEHGMIHVDDDNEEVWIPTAMIDNAADKIETSRRAVQAELGERGVTSSNLSGERVSEAVSRGGTAMRFWRLDLTHDAVPEPETVLDEIEDPVDQLGMGGDDDSAAAADGGTTTPQHTTERFGRPSNSGDGGDGKDQNDDSETETSDDPPENGGDRDNDAADSEGGQEETDNTDDSDSDPPDGNSEDNDDSDDGGVGE
jgi:hypothetical protein